MFSIVNIFILWIHLRIHHLINKVKTTVWIYTTQTCTNMYNLLSCKVSILSPYAYETLRMASIQRKNTFSRDLLRKKAVAVSLVRFYQRCEIFIKSSLWKETKGMAERLQPMFQMIVSAHHVDIRNMLRGYTEDKKTLKYYC